MLRYLLTAWLLGALIGGGAAPVVAQGQSQGALQVQDTARSAVLTLNPERLFAETAFGRRVQSEIEDRGRALAAENREIEAELIAEERNLTERRPTLPIDDFRALADAFDVKVDQLRADQDAKSRELQRLAESERARFFGQIGGVLSRIVQERGASVVLDARNVVLSLERVDITDTAIARIDAEIGDGAPE